MYSFFGKICVGSRFKSVPFMLLALIVALAGSARTATGAVEVETKIDRLEARIGEVFTLTITAVYDSSLRLSAPDIGKTLDTFEVQSALWGDEITLEDGLKARGAEIKLWALDTGRFTIPAIEIPYVTSDSLLKTVSTSAYSVSVLSNLDGPDGPAGPDDSAALAALHEPLENPLFLTERLADRWEFWAGLGVALLIGALLAWRYFRGKQEAPEWMDSRPAWEKAFERLAGLRNSPHLANSEHKVFYSELTNILKEFMGRIISQPALDMTTSELLNAADGQLAFKSQTTEMKSILTQADLVKFAKMSPAPERPERDFETTYTLVQTVRDREIERQELEEERKRLAAQTKSEPTGQQVELDDPSVTKRPGAGFSVEKNDADDEVKNV